MKTQADKDHYAKLVQLIKSVLQYDEALREKYKVGERFVFVRTRLQGLISELEATHSVVAQHQTTSEKDASVKEDYVTVYVYLYNAQGLQIRSWAALLTPKALYEHSINRPIFIDKNEIESLLRVKSNPMQHAYLTVSVVRNDVLSPPSEDQTKQIGLRVREGAFHIERIISLTHNGQEYTLDVGGELVKKTS